MLSAEQKAEADNFYRDLNSNEKHTVARNLNWHNQLLVIMHFASNLQISQISVSR